MPHSETEEQHKRQAWLTCLSGQAKSPQPMTFRRAWGDGSVGRVPAAQTRVPEFKSPGPT